MCHAMTSGGRERQATDSEIGNILTDSKNTCNAQSECRHTQTREMIAIALC